MLRRVASGRVNKKKEARKTHKLCLKVDAAQNLVNQVEDRADHELGEQSSNDVKLVKDVNKCLLKRTRPKPKLVATSTVNQETETMVSKQSMEERASIQGKGKHLRKNFKTKESGSKRTVEIVDEKRRKQREHRRLRRAKKKVLTACRYPVVGFCLS